MAEHPIHQALGGEAIVAARDVVVNRAGPLIRLAFRGDAAAAGKAGAAFGASLPMTPLAANTVVDRAALWLGPDEWLLLASGDDPAPMVAVITAAVNLPHALVDVSERNEALIVAGPKATWLLNSQVFLDLEPSAFPVGTATRTLLGKAEIVLWRTGPEAFVVEVWRSFLPYVEGLLREAARELGAAA